MKIGSKIYFFAQCLPILAFICSYQRFWHRICPYLFQISLSSNFKHPDFSHFRLFFPISLSNFHLFILISCHHLLNNLILWVDLGLYYLHVVDFHWDYCVVSFCCICTTFLWTIYGIEMKCTVLVTKLKDWWTWPKNHHKWQKTCTTLEVLWFSNRCCETFTIIHWASVLLGLQVTLQTNFHHVWTFYNPRQMVSRIWNLNFP